ncbi:MAG: 3-deoxy-D-manno-octulosonic acid transferase, partial [Desulfobacteraceae bacterium]|nr:3-deoxy-D-manno-octulosonic acid transferase [Desulfobacteraceae bacterium]
MIIVYNILITMVFLISLPLLPLLYIFSEKRRANLLLRLGLGGRLAPKKGNEKRIWVHALSVGEVRSAFPLVQSLKKVHPEISIVFTASTKTGFDTAKQLFFQKENRLADHLLYFPFDFWFSVKNVSEKIEPDGILIVETDLWPNFLNFHAKRQIPVVLINARLSNRSLKGYSLFKGFSAMFFSHLSNILVQTR